jgi:hypothetical protein
LLNIPLSISCLSAKDRTGVVSGSLINRHLAAKMNDEKSLLHVADKAERDKLQTKFRDKILSPDGVAVKVVRDNTPNFGHLKARNLLGFTGAARIRSLGGAAINTLFPSTSRPGSSTSSSIPDSRSSEYRDSQSSESSSRRQSISE